MSLNNTTADALAVAICTSLGIQGNATAVANWKLVTRPFYAALKADIIATIGAGTINTAGGPAAQVGPPAPVLVTIS